MNMQLKVELAALTNDHGTEATSLEMVRTCPGTVYQVKEEFYSYFLDVLPPHIMAGTYFCFAEGLVPYTLFWRAEGQCFARQLTWAETKRLAKAAGIPTPGIW